MRKTFLCAAPTAVHSASYAFKSGKRCVRRATRCMAWSRHTDSYADTFSRVAGSACAAAIALSLMASDAHARPEGVNRPELLPKDQTSLIDVAGFLTPSEENQIKSEIDSLERDTGFRLRVLAQNYPETPGLAIRDFWGVDDNTIVFVADPTFGDILNFNVGQGVDLEVPRSFWTRLSGKYGNKFYWQENGEASAIRNAVSAIDSCLREPAGKFKCNKVQGEFGEEPQSGAYGSRFKL